MAKTVSTKPISTFEEPLLRKPLKRSRLCKEFGIENKHGQLNCFLNASLQALWHFPSVRAKIQTLISMPSPGCSKQLSGFVDAFKNFFDLINQKDNSKVPVVDCAHLRVELFKLYYH